MATQQKPQQKKRIPYEQKVKQISERFYIRVYDAEDPMNEEQKAQMLDVLVGSFYEFHPVLQHLKIPKEDIYKQYYEEVYTNNYQFIFYAVHDRSKKDLIVGGGMSQDCIYLKSKSQDRDIYSGIIQNQCKKELDYELIDTFYNSEQPNRKTQDQLYLIRVFLPGELQSLKLAQHVIAIAFIDCINRGYKCGMNIAYNEITQHVMKQYNPQRTLEVDLRNKSFCGGIKAFKDYPTNIKVVYYDFTCKRTLNIISSMFMKYRTDLFLYNFDKKYKWVIDENIEGEQKPVQTPSNNIRPSL